VTLNNNDYCYRCQGVLLINLKNLQLNPEFAVAIYYGF